MTLATAVDRAAGPWDNPGVEQPDRVAARVSDADRDRVVADLRAACAAGYISLDEFAERAGRAYAARTVEELGAVIRELGELVGVAAPGAPRRAETRRVVGIMSGTRVRGRWRPAPHVTAVAFWGGCQLDFRGAEIDGPEVVVTAVAIMGGIDIVVPEGIAVELSGMAIMAGKELRVADVAPRPGTPVIRVKAFAFWGGVTVRSKPGAGARRGDAGVATADRPLGTDPDELARCVLDHVFGPGRRRGAPVPDGTVTVVFTDIEGFTQLTERLGDAAARAVLRDHNAIVRAEVAANGGHEIKAVGDSFMLAFTGVGRALRCVAGIQRALAAYGSAHPEAPLRVRIGVHTGEAVHEDGDLFGRSVIVAARIADVARGGEILASSLTVQLAEGSGEFVFDEGREVHLKGLSQPQRVHALKWEAAG